ncbi:hypothetical protein DMC30DRAFT_67612 [Rhodotorula diobovata]|uniref:Uncharacterized protein n=1 Tax=Rhodotorula diobovata TaxID=5288 RepID=A0A5C5G1X1_9BASI|nr:hypothetical protein DMC30DRAFT_67612 [Rhodotorula diobovata]
MTSSRSSDGSARALAMMRGARFGSCSRSETTSVCVSRTPARKPDGASGAAVTHTLASSTPSARRKSCSSVSKSDSAPLSCPSRCTTNSLTSRKALQRACGAAHSRRNLLAPPTWAVSGAPSTWRRVTQPSSTSERIRSRVSEAASSDEADASKTTRWSAPSARWCRTHSTRAGPSERWTVPKRKRYGGRGATDLRRDSTRRTRGSSWVDSAGSASRFDASRQRVASHSRPRRYRDAGGRSRAREAALAALAASWIGWRAGRAR